MEALAEPVAHGGSHMEALAEPVAHEKGVELESFGLIDIKSQATGRYSVPEVSMVMCQPALRKAALEGDQLGEEHGLAAGKDDVV